MWRIQRYLSRPPQHMPRMCTVLHFALSQLGYQFAGLAFGLLKYFPLLVSLGHYIPNIFSGAVKANRVWVSLEWDFEDRMGHPSHNETCFGHTA